MAILLAGLFWVVVGLWVHHHQRFKAGHVKHPFFAFGKRKSPVSQTPPKGTVRPQTPASAPSHTVGTRRKTSYQRASEARPKPPAVPQSVPFSSPTPPAFSIPATILSKMDRYTYNRDTSERLVRQVAASNPGKTGVWCAEKALWDLERDRR
jgi:hypothetical protein